jgi:methanogenic corrinoid protein MtbC1
MASQFPNFENMATGELARSAADAISDGIQDFAAAVVDRQYKSQPDLRRYGMRGRARCVEDTEYHLEFLIEALNAGSIRQFVDYCAWAKILLSSRGIGLSDLAENFNHIHAVLKSKLTEPPFVLANAYVLAGLEALPQLPTELPPFISSDRPFADIANAYLQAMLLLDRKRASEIVLKASASGVSVKDIYRNVITPAQHEVGRLWQTGQLTVAHEHYCTAATEIVMAELFRQLVIPSPPHKRRIMCFCVEGERHCVGLKMFADLMSLEGWDSTYIGQDTPTSSAIQFISREKPRVIAVSVTFMKNVRSLENLIRKLRDRPEGESTKVLIGGRATSSELCRRVGADGFAENIGEAVEVANRMVA